MSLGLSGKWCPHQRKRRKQLGEEEPKRGRGQRAAWCWCRSVGPESPRPLPARRPRRPEPVQAHLGASAGFQHSVTKLGPVQVVALSLSCPSNCWGQDVRGGASEKESKPLLWPQEVVAGRGTPVGGPAGRPKASLRFLSGHCPPSRKASHRQR